MKKYWYLLFAVLVIVSCSSENKDDFGSISGNYTLEKIITEQAVDYNADDVFDNDITSQVSCSSNLIISANGNVNWVGMDLAPSSYSVELSTGNIVAYSSGNCSTAAMNYSGNITENNSEHILLINDFATIVELKKSEGKLKLQDTESLIVMEDGVLKLKSIIVNYIYRKN